MKSRVSEPKAPVDSNAIAKNLTTLFVLNVKYMCFSFRFQQML